MGGKSKAPAADPMVGIAAMQNAEIGKEWLAYTKEQTGIANERYKEVFEPIENEFIETATNWDSPERQAKLAAEARASVISNADLANKQAQRQQAAMGVKPGSGRSDYMQNGMGLDVGLAAAAAENNARAQSRSQGAALTADVINMGKGLSPISTMGIMRDGHTTAMQGLTNQANILQNQHNSQLQAWNQQQTANSQGISGIFGGIGTLAGLAFSSDEDVKKDKRPARGVLEALKEMPVEEWTYKEGEGDEGRHIGPYAQDFKKATGKGDGKTINVIDAIGVTMGAVQELDRKVEKLAGQAKGKSGQSSGRSIFREGRKAA